MTGSLGSTVVYNENEKLDVLRGTYGDLILNGNHKINIDFTVKGEAEFTSGIQSGSGHWTFEGDASGEINNTGTVTYGSINKIYGLTGTYTNLVANAANLYLTGITLNGTLSGKGTLTFEGENTYGDDAVANMDKGSVVTYAIGATNVLKGEYGNFKLLSNDNGDEIKLTNGNLTVLKLAEIKEGVTFGASSVDPATITFAGTTKGNGTVNFTADTTAVYEANAAVFGGTYYNLTVKGDHAINKDITVNSIAAFTGIQSGNGNWVFNGSATGTGSVNNTSSVTYGENFTRNTFGGSYNDVIINSETAETAGFDVSGTMSGSGKLTVNGEITGSGSAAMDDGSTVTYTDGKTVFNGSYSNLTLGNTTTVNSEVTVNGLATLNGTTAVTGTGVLDFAGTTNAKTGGEIDAQDDSTVSYNGTADIFAAKNGYFNLTLYGERALANAIAKSFSVNGHADITGTQMIGDGIEIVFNGSTNADEVGEVLVPAEGAANTVIYNAGAAVYGGTYYNLTVNGDHAINKDIIVNSIAAFTGIQSGNGNWVFNGSATGTGSVNNTSSVTYGENFTRNTFGGSYNDVIINSETAETAGFDVSGTMSGSGKLTVNGEITGSGSAAMDDGSTVTYTDGKTVFNGSYSNLTLGNTTTVNSEVTVNGLATLNGTTAVTGTGVLDFAGTTNAKTGGEIDAQDYSTVSYNGTADIFAAKNGYFDLNLYGERALANAISKSFSVNGHADITGTQMIGDGVVITFNASTSANDVDAGVLVSAEGAKNTVIYNAAAAVFGGTYYNLVVNGAHTINRNLNIGGDAKFNGLQSGSGNWVFNGTVSGSGSVANTGSVTYNTAVNAFGGSYNNINANADIAFTNAVTVNGVLTGAANVTVTFNTVNAGADARVAMADGSTVIYKAAGSKLLGGTYANLQLDAAGTAANAFAVTGKATLNAVLTVNAGTNIVFGGSTNASELLDGENTRINGADGSTVYYADGAAVFQGRYANLSLADGSIADGEMGYASGKDNGNITVAETSCWLLPENFPETSASRCWAVPSMLKALNRLPVQ